MAERVEERLQDLERLVIKQSERIEELEEHLNAAMRMARQGALRARAQETKAA
jgi:chaperonin cofactor prefoldin